MTATTKKKNKKTTMRKRRKKRIGAIILATISTRAKDDFVSRHRRNLSKKPNSSCKRHKKRSSKPKNC